MYVLHKIRQVQMSAIYFLNVRPKSGLRIKAFFYYAKCLQTQKNTYIMVKLINLSEYKTNYIFL